MKTYGLIRHQSDDKRCWHFSGLPAHVKIKIKRMFESIPKNASEFTIPDTNENNLDIEWFLQRYPMRMSQEDIAYLEFANRSYRDFVEETEKIFKPGYTPKDVQFKDGLALKKYQSVAVELLWRIKRLLCADEVGLGKTVVAIGAMTNKECLPALVVVQPHLTKQWKDQIEKFTNMSTHIIDGRKPSQLPAADVYVIKYTNIYYWIDVLVEMKFQLLVMDEVQEVRRSESNKHYGCKNVADQVPYVLGLSGTPIFNYGNEIHTLYDVIKPDLLGPFDDFKREWCGWMDKVKDPVALGSFLRDSLTYIRRTKSDVKEELPPINKIVHTVGFDQKAIDKMESEAKVLALSVLQGTFVERGQAARELSVMVRKATGVSKARDVANYVKMLCENGEKVLLAGWHRDVYDVWMKELEQYNPVMYTGSETPGQKNKSKEDFVNGDSQVMIISLRSGVGLDGLQASCSYVVFGELDWTPAIHEQVIGRLYRQGQENQVTAIFLVSESGSDPIVTDIIGIKRAQQEGINNPTALGTKQFSDDSIIKEFAKKYLETTNEKTT